MNTGSSASSKPSKWHLAPFLTFLDSVQQERNTTLNIYDTDDNEEFGLDLSDEEVNITQEVQLSPLTQCPQPKSPSISQNTRKRTNLNITELFEKRAKERTQLMSQLCSKQNIEEDDDVDHFFKSLAISVKKLPPHLIAQMKLKLLTVVTDLQFQTADNHYARPSRIYLTPSESTTSSMHSFDNNYTPYNYSPATLDSPLYPGSVHQPSNTFTPIHSVQNMNKEWNTNSQYICY